MDDDPVTRILDNYSMEEVFAKALDGKSPYPHQLETAKMLSQGKSVVLRAPCGSGKTEACYVSLSLGKEILPNRLIYSLPTRALVDEIANRIKEGICKIEPSYSVSAQHGASSMIHTSRRISLSPQLIKQSVPTVALP